MENGKWIYRCVHLDTTKQEIVVHKTFSKQISVSAVMSVVVLRIKELERLYGIQNGGDRKSNPKISDLKNSKQNPKISEFANS